MRKSKYNLVYYPAEILRTTCEEVVDFDLLHKNNVPKSIEKIVKKFNGIGLAGPQVGLNSRIVLIAPEKEPHFFLVNPVIKEYSERKILGLEGCLSLPEIYGKIVRAESIGVTGFDIHGKSIELEASGLTARIIQHEIDHLNGVLFIDNALNITEGSDLLHNLQDSASPNEV